MGCGLRVGGLGTPGGVHGGDGVEDLLQEAKPLLWHAATAEGKRGPERGAG